MSENANRDRLLQYIQKYIYEDASLPVNDMNEIIKRVERVFKDSAFIKEVNRLKKNWMDISAEEALERDIEFVKALQ